MAFIYHKTFYHFISIWLWLTDIHSSASVSLSLFCPLCYFLHASIWKGCVFFFFLNHWCLRHLVPKVRDMTGMDVEVKLPGSRWRRPSSWRRLSHHVAPAGGYEHCWHSDSGRNTQQECRFHGWHWRWPFVRRSSALPAPWSSSYEPTQGKRSCASRSYRLNQRCFTTR